MIIKFPFGVGSIIVYKSEFDSPGKWVVSVWYKGKNFSISI